MENQNEHYRHVLLYYFRKGYKASKAHRKLRAMYGEDALKERQCHNWYAKFRSGNFSLKDDDRPGRPARVDDEQIKALIDRRTSTREMGERLNVSHTCILNHLKHLGYRKILDTWVPHKLKEEDLTRRISICDMLLRRNVRDPFLRRIITGDEKWLVYESEPRGETKHESHRKIMVSVWWDHKGVVSAEFLPRDPAIDSEFRVQHLMRLRSAVREKRPELVDGKGVVFHGNNARTRASLAALKKLLEFGWEELPHPCYSPDLAPSEYHLFRSLQSFLNERKFSDDKEVRIVVQEFLALRGREFYEKGIMDLPERWRKVIDNNGNYIRD